MHVSAVNSFHEGQDVGRNEGGHCGEGIWEGEKGGRGWWGEGGIGEEEEGERKHRLRYVIATCEKSSIKR